MKTTLYTLLVCAALVAFSPNAHALRAPKTSPSPSASAAGPATSFGTQPKAATAASPAGKAERAIPFHGNISSVDAKAKTFSIAGKEKTRTFKITDKTVITKTGQPATMKDVTANEEARGSYWKLPDGSMEVKTLKVGPPTEEEKAAQEKRKERREEKKAQAGGSPSPSASPSASASPH